MNSTQDIFLAHQPILDADQQLVAYELLFRGGHHDSAIIADGRAATATVISHALGHLNLAALLGPYRAFINVDKDFLHSDVLELLPTQQVVLEVLEGGEVTPEVVTRCEALKTLGYTLALDDFTRLTHDYVPLLPLADIIKVDLTLVPPEDLPALVAQLRPLARTLLAEKVETQAEFERCHALGFDLFQGYYFAHPTLVAGRRLQPSQVTKLKLITLLAEDAETHDIERTLKEDPALSVSLLRLVNSVGLRRQTDISSLRQALVLLGRSQLSRWLQLLLYADQGSSSLSPLLIMAAIRGRFCELIAARVYANERSTQDAAYMVGILSLTPTLLGQPMAEILSHLNLAPVLQQALLEHKGPLGNILSLVALLESKATDACWDCLKCFPALNADVVNVCHAEALAWANAIGVDADNPS